MSLKIWFNRWFSTVSHYIEMIRNNPDGQPFFIYGTHPNLESVYLTYCDVAGSEPDIEGDAYLQFCLNFCLENGIDIFVPRKENVLIAQHIEDFEALGVKVLVCPDGDLMSLMDNKAAMYRSIQDKQFEGRSLVPLPAYRVVETAEDFKKAYAELKAEGYRVCIKPVVGEGASGFRLIDDSADTVRFLFSTSSSHKMSYETAFSILQQQERFPGLMVLEYLEGYEYSIDCLSDKSGQLQVAIPRKKGHGRIREIEENDELLHIASQLASEYKIPYVFNIQIKYQDGVPKLLEINPRMSGGLHISCLSGINIPYYAIKLLLQGQIEPLKPNFGIRATHLEQPIVL